jgi:geranylgeranyl reductase family protein
MAEEFDVIVIGGGPSGSSATAFLSKAGKKVLLLDRAKFPREKVCGDGISGRSVGVLRELGLLDSFKSVEHQDMFGVTFSSPNGTVAPIPSASGSEAPGFVCRREVFDNVLFQHAKSLAAKTIEGFFATDLLFDGSRVVGVKGNFDGKEHEFRAKVVVGADGVGGITARKLGAYNNDESHQHAGIRCYYEGVEGMGDKIELHFVDSAVPGYFWIFPLPGKRANVGLCMVVSDMKKKRANLQAIMKDIIENHPVFKPRFQNAKRATEIKSWLLPLASKRMKLAGDGYVLVGDAASLIDPFTGEGIGNALTSGKCASQAILEAFKNNDFTESSLSNYPKALWAGIGNEIDTNHRMQRMANSKFLMNLVIGKAKRSKEVRGVISDAILNPSNHKRLVDPLFFLRALLA